MRKHAYFHTFRDEGWPSPEFLKPYFRKPPPDAISWFPNSGNDSGGLDLIGADGTEHLPEGKGRIDIELSMWGHPELGVLLIYSKLGGGHREVYSSKGDLSKLRQWVRTLHDDPMPVGLYIPFAKAWLAVKEFMETEGKLPTSIEWIKNSDLPEGTFPDPTVRLPGEDD